MIGRDADRPRAGPRQAHLVDREGRVERFSARRGNRRPRIFFSARNWEGGLTRARATIGRGQDLDRLTTRRGCRRASWSRPSTRSPGRSTRGGYRSVRTRATIGRGQDLDRLTTRPVANTLPWSMPAGSFTRRGCRRSSWSIDTRPAPIGRGQTLDRLTTRRGCRRTSWSRPSTRSPGRCWREASRGGCRSVWTRATAAGKTSTGSPRGGVADVHPGRGPRHAPLVDRHAAVADRCGPGRRQRARPRHAHHAAGCRRASWSRPSTRSPGRSTRGGCRSVQTRATAAGETSTRSPRGRVADVHPGRGSRHAPLVDAGGKLHAAGLPNSADPSDGRGQDLDRFTTRRGCRRASWSRPSTRSPGRSTRGGCRSVQTRATAAGETSTRSPRGRVADVHPGRGSRHAPLVDAGGKLHAAGLPNSADPSDGRGAGPRQVHHAAGCRSVRTRATAAGRTSTGSPRGRAADVHPGRGPRHVPPVDAGGTLHAAGLPIGADPGGDRPRAGPRQAHHAAGLLTCILVEALDTFPQSMPAGRFTRPGCRSVRTRATIGRGQDLDRLTTRPGC